MLNRSSRICDGCFNTYVKRLSTVSVQYEVDRSKIVIEELKSVIESTVKEKTNDKIRSELLSSKYRTLEQEVIDGNQKRSEIANLQEKIEEIKITNIKLEDKLLFLEKDVKVYRRTSKEIEEKSARLQELDNKLSAAIKDRVLLANEERMIQEEAEKILAKNRDIEELNQILNILEENKKARCKHRMKLVENKSCLECIVQ